MYQISIGCYKIKPSKVYNKNAYRGFLKNKNRIMEIVILNLFIEFGFCSVSHTIVFAQSFVKASLSRGLFRIQ